MRKHFILLLIGFIFSCHNERASGQLNHPKDKIDKKEAVAVFESFKNLAPLFAKQNDTTYIVNFWATSCPPCIKEMPHFEEINKKYTKDKLRVILVSLDMKEDIESRVRPFIKKHHIKSEVILLADQNYSAWTDKIDPSWYGALPATLIFKNGERKFFFGAFEDFQDLEP
ncbi:MAG: thiol-disulfide isomerase/thioredoxin, partial [Saprospiraceae bacterium]